MGELIQAIQGKQWIERIREQAINQSLHVYLSQLQGQ